MRSVTDTLELDGIEKYGYGMQAQPSAIGLGLPPKQVQWYEGAGDGARVRGRRILPRSIDLRLYLLGRTHDELVQLCRRLAMMLAGPIRLSFWNEHGAEWFLDVEHVGGGDWMYGVDTKGGLDLDTVITLRAGEPMWNGGVPQTYQLISAVMHVDNSGDAKAYPIWTVSGATYFSVTSAIGERFQWQGDGVGTVVFDSRNGLVRDTAGNNRYAGMSPAPTFFTIPPGRSRITVNTNASSASVLWTPRRWAVL